MRERPKHQLIVALDEGKKYLNGLHDLHQSLSRLPEKCDALHIFLISAPAIFCNDQEWYFVYRIQLYNLEKNLFTTGAARLYTAIMICQQLIPTKKQHVLTV